MKKIGIIGLLITGVLGVYYFTTGSKQITMQMKTQLNQQLSSLEAKGFVIEKRENTAKSEHFVVNFNDANKIASLLQSKGINIAPQDLKALKGFKVGVDVTYLADVYSAISLDMYPLTLPDALTTTKLNKQEQKALIQFQEMIQRKVFLMHIDVNKLGNGFKGYMKDIDELLRIDNKSLKISMQTFRFNGAFKEKHLLSLEQTLKNFTLSPDNKFIFQLNNLKSNYESTGTSQYAYSANYHIDDVTMQADKNFALLIHNLSARSISQVHHDLLNVSLEVNTENIQSKSGNKKVQLNTIAFKMNTDNLDINAIQKLETIDPNNKQEIQAVFQELLSKGIRFEIPDFSVKHIDVDAQNTDGFTLKTLFTLDKTFNLNVVQRNPLLALSAIDATLNLTLSSSFFGFIAQLPQATMAMMFLQPKDVNGNKVYDVELQHGTLKVNGKPVM